MVPNSGQTGSLSFLIFRQLNLTTGQDDRAKHGHGEDHSGQFQRDGKGFNQCHANPADVVFNGQPSQLALERTSLGASFNMTVTVAANRRVGHTRKLTFGKQCLFVFRNLHHQFHHPSWHVADRSQAARRAGTGSASPGVSSPVPVKIRWFMNAKSKKDHGPPMGSRRIGRTWDVHPPNPVIGLLGQHQDKHVGDQDGPGVHITTANPKNSAPRVTNKPLLASTTNTSARRRKPDERW